MYSIIAAAAVMATAASAMSVGSAHVVNKCEYDVYLANVPSQNGGYEEIDKTLSSGDSYSQGWTELTNGNGWSIKLSQNTSFSNILQYEYTFHDDGIIWYDLSKVNGNPWDGNWEITAESPSSTCSPKQQAYRYATDDAYGMQACPQDAAITVTLCSGESQNDGGAASASSSVAAVTSSLATASEVSTFTTPSSAVPTFTSASEVSSSEVAISTTLTSSYVYTGPHRSVYKQDNAAASTPSSTTFATLTTSASSTVVTPAAGVTVTDVATAVVTEIVTAYGKRHEHRRRHGRA